MLFMPKPNYILGTDRIIADGKAMADLVLAEYGGRFVFSVTVDELHP